MKNQNYILIALGLAAAVYFFMNKPKEKKPITPGVQPGLPPTPGKPTEPADSYPGTTEDKPMPYVAPKETAPKTELEDNTNKKGNTDSELAGLY